MSKRALNELKKLHGLQIQDITIGSGNLLRVRFFSGGDDEISLRTWGCPWCIHDQNNVIAGSDDAIKVSTLHYPELAGATVENVTVDRVVKSLDVRLDNGFGLRTFVSQSKGGRYSLQWIAHFPQRLSVVVRAGGRCRVEREPQ